MSGNPPSRRPKKKASGSGQGKGRGRGKKGSKQRGKKQSNQSAIDPKRPLWENNAGEAEVQAIVGSVRPAQHPTATVRSLGDPPLGKFASNAHHYFDAVYDKAQHFAVAIATANGLLVVGDDEDGDDGETSDGDNGKADKAAGSGNSG